MVSEDEQRTQQQPGAAQQQDRRGDLTGNDQTPEPASLSRGRSALRRDRLHERASRGLPRRHHPEQHSSNQAGCGTERHDAAIEGETHGRWQEPGGDHCECQLQNRDAESQTEQTTERRKHQALGQQLRDDAGPSRAERRSHGELTRPDAAARQEQVRDVGATQKQNEADDAKEEQRCQLQVGAHHARTQRLDGDAEALVSRGIVAREPLAERGEIGARGLQRDTRLQAPDDLKRPCPASCRNPAQCSGNLRQQRPDARRPLELHIVRHDPDDREWLAVQPDVSTDE